MIIHPLAVTFASGCYMSQSLDSLLCSCSISFKQKETLNKDKSAYKSNTFLWKPKAMSSNVPLKIVFPLCKCQNQFVKGQGLHICSWESISTTWAVKRLNDICFDWRLMHSMLISCEIVQKWLHLCQEKVMLMEKKNRFDDTCSHNIHHLLNVPSNS